MNLRTLLVSAFLILLGAPALFAQTPAESYTKGMKYYDQALWDKAVESLQETVKLDPQHWEAYQMLSYTYYKLNDRKASADAAEASLKIHSNNPKLRQFASRVKEGKSPSMPPPPDERIASASEASAAELSVTNSIYVNGGLAFPVGPTNLTGNWSLGPDFGIGLGLGLSKTFQVVLDANIHLFPSNSANPSGSFKDILALVNGRLQFTPENNPVVPYGILGAGASFLFQDAPKSAGPTPSTIDVPGGCGVYWAARAGLGFDLRLSDYASIFVEGDGVATGYLGYGMVRLGGKFNL